MNTQSRLAQRVGGLGIVFTALFAAAFVLFGGGVSESDSGAAVVNYYSSRRGTEIAAVFALALSLVALTFFLAALRQRLARDTDSSLLAGIVTVGGAVFSGGVLLSAVDTLGLVDSAHYGMASAAQTLNVIGSDDWVPVVVGIAMLALGTGTAALRSGALPRWLGVVSIIFGVLAVSGPAGAIAFLLMPVWTLVVAIVLMRAPATKRDEVPMPVAA